MIFNKGKVDEDIEKKIVDSIRSLGLDMINKAGSGHPGIVLGAAPILYTLYGKHLNINPEEPNWYNRDRFIMSAGHGSALLYATLFTAGYDISIDDLKQFRMINSKTPGHPECGITPGVDMSTGPLGQGFASSIGMAIAEEYTRNYFKSKKNSLVDYHIYVLCSDGDLMEGISYEAASLAGTLKLSKLIVLYDSNNVSLDGSCNKVFNEDVANRFLSMGWNVITVEDGENLENLNDAITKAKSFTDRPTLVEIKTVIGKYSKNEGSNKAHGTPLDKEDLENVKEKLNVRNIPFTISHDVVSTFQNMINDRVKRKYKKWQNEYSKLDDETKKEFTKLIELDLSQKVNSIDYKFPENNIESLRITSGKVLNSIAKDNPLFMGGSADVSLSTKTYLDDALDFSFENRLGRNILFGVREHAMGAIANGLVLSGIRPFVSTFLPFADYMKPAIRMAALMKLPVIYIFTHDSITVGEDGPTHQAVEQLAMLRSIPNLEVYRPADANEVIGAYKVVMARTEGPSAIILSRNDVKIQENTSVKDVALGAYIIKKEEKDLHGIILSCGEDVAVALEVQEKLQAKGLGIRVVSVPSIEKFLRQKQSYQDEILPKGVKVIAIESGSPYSWYGFVSSKECVIAVDDFGLSAKKETLVKKFGLDSTTVALKIEKLLK
ncbi:MAG: transketolase [Bacilli bacterium]|nr:transketolase [Bacilli bacterium]